MTLKDKRNPNGIDAHILSGQKKKCVKAESWDHHSRLKGAVTGIWHCSQYQMYLKGLLPMKQRCLADNWWQKLFFSSNDDVAKYWPELGCASLFCPGTETQCICNWTEAHYTVTLHRDLLFRSRNKVSMPAGEYNCSFYLLPHEKLLIFCWPQQLNYSSSWN